MLRIVLKPLTLLEFSSTIQGWRWTAYHIFKYFTLRLLKCYSNIFNRIKICGWVFSTRCSEWIYLYLSDIVRYPNYMIFSRMHYLLGGRLVFKWFFNVELLLQQHSVFHRDLVALVLLKPCKTWLLFIWNTISRYGRNVAASLNHYCNYLQINGFIKSESSAIGRTLIFTEIMRILRRT